MPVFQAWFLELYLKLVWNSKDKPLKALNEAFQPLLQHMTHDDFGKTVLPTASKMLKRNPELVMESFGCLLMYTNLDLSIYTMELLPTVLLQARHSDENRRKESVLLVNQLVLHSSDLDTISAMFQSIRSVISGSLSVSVPSPNTAGLDTNISL